ncbi:MAG: Coenzyme F420 hydrogenase/dehydrogenase, beta subunit C-terminal domain [Desulfatibacillum sp.]|nr:Coenzyme F420 hydrogenase/dehydrogenase, beta subunit C-terminal domain [Desulfatibacillum sp.]
MKLFAQTQLLEDVQGKGLCVGCGACVDLCPYFTTYRGKTAMLFPCDRETGRCFAYCPKAEVDYDAVYQFRTGRPFQGTPIGPHIEVFKARAGEKQTECSFQCGGTVTALISCALDNKIINGAVLTGSDERMPKPMLVRTADQAQQCAGSKYSASPTLAVMNKEAKRGVRKMGIVATPCQATAIAQMKMNPTDKEDFEDPVSLVIGLFCTWALDARKLEALLEEKGIQGTIIKADVPPPPAEVFVVETDQGVTEIPLSEVRKIIPEGCSICPDMTSELADISVGQVEGETGYNTLIVRTEKGAELVKMARSQGYLVTENLDGDKVHNLAQASGNKKKRALAQAQEKGLLNTPDDAGRAAMRMSQDALNKIQP